MGQTFLFGGAHHIPTREELTPSTKTTVVQLRLLPRSLTWSVGCIWFCISVVFLSFCSSGLGVACLSVPLGAREYEWNEANNFTNAYDSKHSTCIHLLRNSIFLLLAACQEISRCWGNKDEPHTSPALGVLSVGPAHVKPRTAPACQYSCV